MPNSVKILVIGDIVGRGGRTKIIKSLSKIREKYQADFIVANGENATNGNGLNYKHYKELVNAGCDVITMGNHVFGNKEIYSYAKEANRLVIPCNIKNLDECFNKNLEKTLEFCGKKIKVINILGQSNIRLESEHPFVKFRDIDDHESIYVVDYHAELTAEKNVFGYNLDGKASIMFGTHTHVQTADERIMPQGMAYISDVGMCGARESVIGFNYQEAVKGQWEGTPYSVEKRPPIMLNAMLVEIDLESRRAINILRINEDLE